MTRSERNGLIALSLVLVAILAVVFCLRVRRSAAWKHHQQKEKTAHYHELYSENDSVISVVGNSQDGISARKSFKSRKVASRDAKKVAREKRRHGPVRKSPHDRVPD